MNDISSGPLGCEATISDEDYWQSIEFSLSEIRDLFRLPIETREEAVLKKKAHIGEQKARGNYNKNRNNDVETQKIPYIDGIDYEDLYDEVRLTSPILASVEMDVKNQGLTPSFVSRWGAVNRVAGAIGVIYGVASKPGYAHAGYAGGKAKSDASEAHKRWYAHYFLRIYERGQWKHTEKTIERLINAIIDGEIPAPVGYDVKWFEAILQVDDPKSLDYLRVRPAFRRRKLSTPKMEELVAAGIEGIPPVDLQIPYP